MPLLPHPRALAASLHPRGTGRSAGWVWAAKGRPAARQAGSRAAPWRGGSLALCQAVREPRRFPTLPAFKARSSAGPGLRPAGRKRLLVKFVSSLSRRFLVVKWPSNCRQIKQFFVFSTISLFLQCLCGFTKSSNFYDLSFRATIYPSLSESVSSVITVSFNFISFLVIFIFLHVFVFLMMSRSEYEGLKFDTEYFGAEEDLMINDKPGTLESVCLFWRTSKPKTYYYGKRCKYCCRHSLRLSCSDSLGVKFAPKEIALRAIIQTEKCLGVVVPDGLH